MTSGFGPMLLPVDTFSHNASQTRTIPPFSGSDPNMVGVADLTSDNGAPFNDSEVETRLSKQLLCVDGFLCAHDQLHEPNVSNGYDRKRLPPSSCSSEAQLIHQPARSGALRYRSTIGLSRETSSSTLRSVTSGKPTTALANTTPIKWLASNTTRSRASG